MSYQTQKRPQKRPQKRARVYLALIILGLLILAGAYTMRTTIASALPQTSDAFIEQAWQKAINIGRYHYRSTILQTTHPTARLDNLGQRSTTEQYLVAGDLDRHQETMQLQLDLPNQPPLAIKVAAGVAYGRLNANAEWTELDNGTDLFAPGGDPMGFLSAVENVHPINGTSGLTPEQKADDATAESEFFPSGLLPAAVAQSITRYAFDLDGPQYADYMRTQMAEQLRRKGELPNGIALGQSDVYLNMESRGELWINADGLPMRQIIHLSFPPVAGAHEWFETEITTDFSNWAAEPPTVASLLWQNPQQLFSNPALALGLSNSDLQQLGYTLGLLLLLLGVMALVITYRRARFVRVPVVATIILSMVITPLLQTQRVSAFYDNIEGRQLEYAANRAAQMAATQPALALSPHKNPLESGGTESMAAESVAAESVAASVLPAMLPQAATAPCDTIVPGDADCDGDADNDDDGLTDNVELFELGTRYDDPDTDNDGISDYAEVQGFVIGGQTWYLDPTEQDTNGDSIADGLECFIRYDIDTDDAGNEVRDSSITVESCGDFDGDSVPDIWDFDDDGDGVPDNTDLTPGGYETVTDKEFGLVLNNVEAGKSVFVDVELRPLDDRHLWWTNSVMDWPSGDNQGQILRMTDDTLTPHGDMVLSPVLEIELPYSSANPSRGLPLSPAFSGSLSSIGATTPIDEWLDQDRLRDDYDIAISQDGAQLFAYVPLAVVKDQVGGAPVAWRARMLYEMNAAAAGWGDAHQMRLLWIVNALTDSCIVPTDESIDEWCESADNWVSITSVIQTYREDFILTGLAVQENHGITASTFAQKPNTGDSSAYESDLWHLADTLEATFLQARTDGGSRFGITDINDHYATWFGSNAADLNVSGPVVYADPTEYLKATSGDSIQSTLDSVHGAGGASPVNLLFVNEEATRSRTLGAVEIDDAGTTITQVADFVNNVATVDFSGAEINTIGALRMRAYANPAGTAWVTADLIGYLDTLETNLATLFTDAQLQSMAGNSIDDLVLAREGALFLAQNYYLALDRGAGSLLQMGDIAISVDQLTDHGAYALPVNQPVIVAIVADLLAGIQGYYAQISLQDVGLTSADGETPAIANAAWVELANSTGALLEAFGDIVRGDTASSAGIAIAELGGYPSTATNDDLLNLSAVNSASAAMIALDVTIGNWKADLLLVGYALAGATLSVSNAAWSISRVFQIVAIQKKIRGVQQKVTAGGLIVAQPAAIPGVATSFGQLKASVTKWGVIGMATTVAIAGVTVIAMLASGAVEPNSPELNQLIARTVAGIVIDAVLTGLGIALSASGIGTLALALLGLIDALIVLACALAGDEVEPGSDVDVWVCGGITGALTEGLSYVLNDYTPLVDLEHKDRLQIAFDRPDVTQLTDNPGFVVGNQIDLRTNVTTTLYMGEPNWMGYVYGWQLDDDYLDNATFNYELQETQKDITPNLEGSSWTPAPGRSEEEWTDVVPPDARFFKVAAVSLDHVFPTAGINQGLDVYFAEGFSTEAQNCWLVPSPVGGMVPACWLEEFDDTNHEDLSDDFYFDLLPGVLDKAGDVPGFRTMALVENDSYRMSWDDQFPVLYDADNDGLVSKAKGGIDPNDNNPDSDGDGLGDYFEERLGYALENPDVDCDGLTDYWEYFYGTDPFLADTDNDGLTDGAEFFHPNTRYPYENSALSNTNAPTCATDSKRYTGGWDVVYDYAGDQPLRFGVSANPNDPDSDDDSISDQREFIYGYHPDVSSTLNVLAINTTIQSETNVLPYVKPGETITYAATVNNNLRDRYARGLLQSEFPVDQVWQTKELATLAPLGSVTMNGTLPINVTSSLVTSMTLRAGAVIVQASEPTLQLRMNESTGATAFTDASLPSYPFTCSGAACPTANGRYLDFNNDLLTNSVAAPALLSPGSFTVGAWVNALPQIDAKPTTIFELGNSFTFEVIGFRGQISKGGALVASADLLSVLGTGVLIGSNPLTADPDWFHVAATYDAETDRVAIYVNGTRAVYFNANGQRRDNISLGGAPSATSATLGGWGAIDDLQLYPSIPPQLDIRELAGAASIQLDLTETPEGTTCSGERCPSYRDAGATFNQRQHIAIGDSALELSTNEFSFALWMKPEARAAPFDPLAANLFDSYFVDHDVNEDWQGVFGYQKASDPKSVYPSMYVSDAGRLRMVMGDGTNLCTYESPSGVKAIQYDAWQHVSVTYDGSAFTLYVDGQFIDSSAITECFDVSLANVPNSLYIGRPNDYGYIHFEEVYFESLYDGPANKHAEVCLNFNDNSENGDIWHDFNVDTPDGTNSTTTETIGKQELIGDGANNWLRLSEDDGTGADECEYSSSPDEEFVYVDNLSNISHLGTRSTSFDQGGPEFPTKGTLYWSHSNDFFMGSLNDFRLYSYALTPQLVDKVYQNATFALQMPLDEAPGEQTFVDKSGSYFIATCNDLEADSCPDSGIPGRVNQALRFDGGVADDDGNDGTADYATLTADTDALNFYDSSFTVMAWVKADDLSGNRTILGTDSTAANQSLQVDLNNGRPHLGFGNNGLTGATTVPTDEWVHLAWVYEKSKLTWQEIAPPFPGLPGTQVPVYTNEMALYVNGVLDTAEEGHDPFIGTDLVHIGRSRGGRYFDGLIDDLRIVKKVLGANEIQSMLNEAPIINLHLDEDLLDETQGTSTFISEGAKNLDGDAALELNAECSGTTCPKAGDKGQMREAAVFDGDDLLTIDISQMALQTRFTVGMWVKPTKHTTSDQWLIRQSDAHSTLPLNFALSMYGDSLKLHPVVQSGCNSFLGFGKRHSFDSVGTLLENQWNHVVMTFDGGVRLYINGSEDPGENRVIVVTGNDSCAQSNDTITLGEHFIGNLDEVTVTPEALDAEAVQGVFGYQSQWFDVKEQHSLRVDADKPVAELNYTLDYVSPGQPLVINATDASANHVASGIAAVEVQISSGGWQAVPYSQDGWLFTFPDNLTSGAHTIQVRATDNVGYMSDVTSKSLLVDANAPSVLFLDAGLSKRVLQVHDELVLNGLAQDVESGLNVDSLQLTVRDHTNTAVSAAIGARPNIGTGQANGSWVWAAEQPFDSPPYGTYTIDMSIEDHNALKTTAEATVQLDGYGPYADVVMASRLITESGTLIRGIANDSRYPQVGRSVHFHFEEGAGATGFVDARTNGFTATCDAATGACPTAGTDGKEGSALTFDGQNDYLAVPPVLDPAATAFTAAMWFQTAEIGPGQRILLSQQDGTGTGRTWLGLNAQGRLFTFLGGSGIGSSAPINVDEWHHAAVSYDGQTLSLYLDGQLVSSEDRTLETSDGDTVVGTSKRLGDSHFAGAIDELVIYSKALGDAEVYDIANPLNVGIAQTQLRFRHASGAVWPGINPSNVALYLPLDEGADATSFDDFSLNDQHATCAIVSAQCPVAGASGKHAAALTFDGVDDYLTLPHVLDPAATAFSAAAWFKVTDLAKNQLILQQQDGTGIGRTWLLVNTNGTVRTNVGGTALSGTSAVQAGAWNHVAVSYDGTTVQLYLNGLLEISQAASAEANVGELLIGVNKGLTNYYNGSIDEVVIFDRALTIDEVQALNTSPWADVNLASTNATLTPWSYTLDHALEGPYKIDLYGTDALGNSSLTLETWTGVIDTVAPRLTFEYVPDADYRNAQVRCTADDENLTEAGWACPVDNSNRSASYQDADWHTKRFSSTQMLTQLTTAVESVVVEPNPTMSACDLFGHCSTVSADVAVLAAIAASQGAAAQAATVSAAAAPTAASGTAVSIYSTLQLVNTPVELSTVYAAYDAAVHTATWTWGDGTTSPATVDAASGAISGSHAYGAAGFYAATLNVTASDGNVVAFTVPFDVVVYDPDAGKTAGGGKIDSPAGAYKLDASISGLADFNLPVDYQNKATQPKGNFRFGLSEANLDFVADAYEWLIVYPDSTAMAKGTGTINGQMDANGNPYRFWFWATDGNTDTLRVRIWSEDDGQYVWWQDAGGTVIYDNGSELPINNGNVQVIVSKGNGQGNGNGNQVDDASTTSDDAGSTSGDLPTPVAETVDVAVLDQQIFLPLVTNQAVPTEQVVDDSSSQSAAPETESAPDDLAAPEVEIVPDEPVTAQADEEAPLSEEAGVVLAERIFLPLVTNAD